MARASAHGGAHGLFAKHMLARFGGADGVLGMLAVGQADINSINGRVVAYAVVLFVGVNGGLGHAVLGGQLACFCRVSADQAGDFAVLRSEQARHKVVDRDAAKPDDAVADACTGDDRRSRLGLSAKWVGNERGTGSKAGHPGEIAA